jgi:hypothetical protein
MFVSETGDAELLKFEETLNGNPESNSTTWGIHQPENRKIPHLMEASAFIRT